MTFTNKDGLMWGGVEVAQKAKLAGKTVSKVTTAGGWLILDFEDGSELLVGAEYGQSLTIDFAPPTSCCGDPEDSNERECK